MGRKSGAKVSSKARDGAAAGTGFLGAMLTGIASRSAATAKVHRLYRDGNASESDFEAAIRRDSEELLSNQSGFAYASSGQLDWLDLFRPIARSLRGFAARPSSGEDAVGPVTRWFRTNTFYRKPLVSGRIGCSGGELADVVPMSDRPAVIFLPAPYSFSRMVENSFYGTTEELAMDYSMAVAKSAPLLLGKGYRCILLLDHLVGYEQSRKGFSAPDWYSKALSNAKSAGMRTGVHYPYADAGRVVGLADPSSLDFIGIDAIFDSDAKIDTSKDLLIGAVDGARVGVETAKSIEASIRRVTCKADFSGNYYVGPRDRLYDVPFETALQKVMALSKVRGA